MKIKAAALQLYTLKATAWKEILMCNVASRADSKIPEPGMVLTDLQPLFRMLRPQKPFSKLFFLMARICKLMSACERYSPYFKIITLVFAQMSR